MFTAAGCFWILIYVLHFLEKLDHAQLASLRGGQTPVYFILLTLWGLEYMREVRRYKLLVALAEESCCAVGDVELFDLDSSTSVFAVLGPVGSNRSYVFPMVNIVGLTAAAVLILMRYAATLQQL